MKSRLTITLVLLCMSANAIFAQQKMTKPRFHSQEQLALVNGNSAVSTSLQSINGLQVNNWFAGVGVGIDFYRYRSVPLFLDVKRYVDLRNKNKLFIYADVGYNIPWSKKDDEPLSIWGWPSKVESKYKGGAYMDAGLGYTIQFRKGNALLLSAGYSHKYFSETRSTTWWQGGVAGTGEQTTNTVHYKYSFNRLMIKLGWQF